VTTRRVPALRCFPAAALAVLLAACGGSSTELQPLAPGFIWRYAVTVHVGDSSRRSVLEERSTGALPGAGSGTFGLLRQDGTLSVLERREGGVELVSVADESGNRTPVEPREWVVPPEGVEGWSVASHTGLIERRVDDFEEAGFRLPVRMQLRYRMLDGMRTVEVPAGRFEGCRELLGQGHQEVVRNRRGQLTRITVEQHDFYCPGTGLTLRERSESTDNPIVFNGSYRQELLELRRP
jgi:hypothetical protein